MEYITHDADPEADQAGGGGGVQFLQSRSPRRSRPDPVRKLSICSPPPIGKFLQEKIRAALLQIFTIKNLFVCFYSEGMTVYMTDSDPDPTGVGVPCSLNHRRFCFGYPIP